MQLARVKQVSGQMLRHVNPLGLFMTVALVFIYSSVYWTTFSDSILSFRAHQVPFYSRLPEHLKFDNETTLEYMKEKRTIIKSDIHNILMILGSPTTGAFVIIKENLVEAIKSWGIMLTVKIVRLDDGSGIQRKMMVDENGHLVPYDKTEKILRWSKEIEFTAKKHHIDPAIIAAIIEQESGGDPNAGSSAGAQGLMQLMPRTAKGLGVDPWNPLQNIDGGTRYFLYQYKRFGNLEQALAAYNAGPGNVINGNYLYIGETQRYIRNVPVLVNKYQHLFAANTTKKK